MFIQHGDYVINVDQINFMKINSQNFSVSIFFEANPAGSGAGSSIKLNFDNDLDLVNFLEKFE